jgi:hypothetical protein
MILLSCLPCGSMILVSGQPRIVTSSASKAVVTLAGGTSYDFETVSLFGDHVRLGHSGMSQPGEGVTPHDWAIREINDTSFWRTVPRADIRQMRLTRRGRDAEWFESEFTLTSGERVRGRLPLSLTGTWMSGDALVLAGKTDDSDAEEDFQIDLEEVMQVATDASTPGLSVVTGVDMNKIRVTGLHLGVRWTRPPVFLNRGLSTAPRAIFRRGDRVPNRQDSRASQGGRRCQCHIPGSARRNRDDSHPPGR